MKENTIALVGPHHDPSGALVTGLTKHLTILKSIFDVVAVSVTDSTDSRVFKQLEIGGIHYQKRDEDGDISKRYRSALKMGLEDNLDHFLLLDFDRALHWAASYPDELKIVAEQIKNSDGITSLVRSQRAFETHPQTQRDTEVVANQVASEIVGKKVDILSGGWGMDKETATLISQKATKEDFGFYGQVLALAHQEKLQINTIEVEGLEWETPDQHKSEINKFGYMGWLSNFQTLEEWEKRLTLAFEAGTVFKSDSK